MVRAGDMLVAPSVVPLTDGGRDPEWTPTLALEVARELDLRAANILHGEGVSKKVVEAGRTGPGVVAFGKSSALVQWGAIRNQGLHLCVGGLASDRLRKVSCPCGWSGTRRAWNEHMRGARRLAACPFGARIPLPAAWDNFGGCLVEDCGYRAEGYTEAVDAWRFVEAAD